MIWKVNPLEGKTINWRAGCGKTASPVRREGEPNPIGSPYPYNNVGGLNGIIGWFRNHISDETAFVAG